MAECRSGPLGYSVTRHGACTCRSENGTFDPGRSHDPRRRARLGNALTRGRERPMNAELARPTRTQGQGGELARLPLLDGVHVLVVDDDEDAREAVAAVLESCGAEVVAAAGAAGALESLQRARPDVIVSDISMPAMDGHQLIRCIRTLDAERGGKTPAAALTAYATSADRTRALLAGFQVYLAKPFDPSELVTLVAHLAGRPSA